MTCKSMSVRNYFFPTHEVNEFFPILKHKLVFFLSVLLEKDFDFWVEQHVLNEFQKVATCKQTL